MSAGVPGASSGMPDVSSDITLTCRATVSVQPYSRTCSGDFPKIMQCQATHHEGQVPRMKTTVSTSKDVTPAGIMHGSHGGRRARGGFLVWPGYDLAVVASACCVAGVVVVPRGHRGGLVARGLEHEGLLC